MELLIIRLLSFQKSQDILIVLIVRSDVIENSKLILLDYLRTKRNFNAEKLQGIYSRLDEWHLEQKDFTASYGCLYKVGDVERILSHLNKPENIRNELTGFEGSFEMFNTIPR